MNKRPMIRKNVRTTVKTKKQVETKKEEKVDRSLEAIEMYRNYLAVERNYSNYTVLNYIKDIEDFYEYLKGDNFGNLLTVTKTNVPRYYL